MQQTATGNLEPGDGKRLPDLLKLFGCDLQCEEAAACTRDPYGEEMLTLVAGFFDEVAQLVEKGDF
jgi:hypothetical protein